MLLLLCVLAWVLLASPALAANRFASPTGTGTVCSDAVPCTPQQCAVTGANAGDTCWLKDGLYIGANYMLNLTKSGTNGNPITVKAVNDGAVLISGRNDNQRFGNGVRTPLFVPGSWLVIQGFNVCCGNATPVETASGASNLVFDRMISWDGHSSNTNNGSAWGITGATDVLLTRVAGWGGGRKGFGAIGDTRTTVIDGFFFKGCYQNNGGVGTTFGYNTINRRMYNIISTMDVCPEDQGVNFSIFGTDHYGTYTGPQPNNIVHNLDSIIGYHMDAQPVKFTSRVIRASFANDAIPAGLNINVHTISKNLLAIRRNAANPLTVGIEWPAATAKVGFTRSFWTDSLGTLAGGNHTTDGGVKNISQFNNGLLQLNATVQPAFGAWMRYLKNADGTNSATAWFPLAMNDRIQVALQQSGYDVDGAGGTDLTAHIMAITGSTISTEPPPVPPTGPFYANPVGGMTPAPAPRR